MSYKRLLIVVACVLLAAALLCFVWWYLPTTFLKNVEHTDVARIEVFNGSTGQRFAIENADDIEYIVRKIGDVKLRKAEYSHVDGFAYSISFKAADGTVLERFILNASDSIRDGAIRYEVVLESYEDPLCFEYIKTLEQARQDQTTQ